MANRFFDPAPLLVVDGDVAVAEDLNSVSGAVEAAFDDNALEIDAMMPDIVAARNKAQKWAEELEDVAVETGKFSSLHHAAKANASAIATAADKVSTNADAVATAADRVAVAADLVLTDADTVATAADRVQTGLDAVATAADKVATNADVVTTSGVVADATAAKNKAEEWADKAEDVVVETGQYSAKHHAIKAAASAANLPSASTAGSEKFLRTNTAGTAWEYRTAADQLVALGIAGTDLSIGTRTTTTVPVNSSTGANVDLPAATTSLAGVMTSDDKTKLDGIADGAQVNVATDLTATAGTTAGPTINSSTGTNVVIPSASATASGVVNTTTQTFAGVKTFSSQITGSISGNAAGTATNCSRQIINGNGMNFTGGALTADRTITLGTPATLTTATTNAVSASSHTHAVTFPAAAPPTALNAIGTYRFGHNATTTAVAAGGTLAGSSIRVSTLASSGTYNSDNFPGSVLGRVQSGTSNFPTSGTTTLAGTWRAMHGVQGRQEYHDGNNQYYYWYPTLWLRIS